MHWPVLFAAVVAASTAAAEQRLVMLEAPGCVWCERWRQEIGVAYPNTEEGRSAPLRVVDISRGWPEDLAHVAPDRVTPTFILMRDGAEVSRLRGYPGAEFFWPMLSDMLDAAPSD
ncbi:MAG: transcriptional regulator [Rubrimonas sp.]